jgi:hypothetical protein
VTEYKVVHFDPPIQCQYGLGCKNLITHATVPTDPRDARPVVCVVHDPRGSRRQKKNVRS